jgi:hypothetical protein
VSASSKAYTNLMDVTFDALMGQHLATIDQHLGITIDFDSVVGERLHDSFDFGTLRIIALAICRAAPSFTRDVHSKLFGGGRARLSYLRLVRLGDDGAFLFRVKASNIAGRSSLFRAKFFIVLNGEVIRSLVIFGILEDVDRMFVVLPGVICLF